jgi:hypothetical protein
MEKLSGLVLDFYDDPEGAVLRSIFPDADSIPSLIKEAQSFAGDERAELPDDLFALILHDGDVTLRKFACADSGNTALSVAYFLKTAHKLPEVAQKVAAQNLLTACGWYDIDPPEDLTKVAIGLNTVMTAAMVPGAVKETKANLNAVQPVGGNVMTPAQMKMQRLAMGV